MLGRWPYFHILATSDLVLDHDSSRSILALRMKIDLVQIPEMPSLAVKNRLPQPAPRTNPYSTVSSLSPNGERSGAFTTAWASPTCRRSVTSRYRSLRRLRRMSGIEDVPAVCNCYWRGSEEDDRRFRCRYTSVP